MLVLNNFFFCHHVFKKLSAPEASESVYMRERVKKRYCTRRNRSLFAADTSNCVCMWARVKSCHAGYKEIKRFELVACWTIFQVHYLPWKRNMLFSSSVVVAWPVRKKTDVFPFSTYNNSTADDFKTIYAKIWKTCKWK